MKNAYVWYSCEIEVKERVILESQVEALKKKDKFSVIIENDHHYIMVR